MNFFATPVSSFEPFDNYKRTVVQGVEYGQLQKLGFPDRGSQHEAITRLWGIRINKKNTWKKIAKGDILFFYNKKHIISYCEIMGTHESSAIAESLWGTFENAHYPKYTWPLLIILGHPHPCNIPFTRFNEILNYDENYSLRTFIKLADNFPDHIGSKYGTVQDFAEAESVPG